MLVLILINLGVLNFLLYKLYRILKEKDIIIHKQEYHYEIPKEEFKIKYNRKKK